ncbi:MAG: ribonuclease III [Opitutaceae bacterium]|nr:ribonuclease III [Opitutaceae bacterium]
MAQDTEETLLAFQDRIGHRFGSHRLLERSLTHASVQQDDPEAENNQRLEFLGDAVLQLVVSEELHSLYVEDREGELTRRRAILTRGSFLADLARQLGVHEVLRVSASERASRGHERDAALEDAMEALAAAIYLDAGWETARRVVLAWLGDIPAHLAGSDQEANPKGRLQELVQPQHGNSALAYKLLGTEGPPHRRRFEVAVMLFDDELGRGTGASKKEAEEVAARAALRRWADRHG